MSTNNNGTIFFNENSGRSYNLSATSSLQSLINQPCSEVIILNKTGSDLFINDNNFFALSCSFVIGNGESIRIGGVTNSNQISARITTGVGLIYYRTQNFSSFNL
jgi:hypothetical protein